MFKGDRPEIDEGDGAIESGRYGPSHPANFSPNLVRDALFIAESIFEYGF